MKNIYNILINFKTDFLPFFALIDKISLLFLLSES